MQLEICILVGFFFSFRFMEEEFDMLASSGIIFTQVNRMSKSRRVLAIGGRQRSFGLHMVCLEMVLYHNEPY